MGRLFGTDGVRGKAGAFLTAQMAFDLGAAGAKVLAKADKKSVIIGTDTRASCDMLAAALAAGFCSVGADVHMAGIVPTPALAYLVRKYGFSAGVMVSASHNAFEDNGIKFYNGQGHKLSDEIENEIEAAYGQKAAQAQGAEIGRIYQASMAEADYVGFLQSTVNTNLHGKKIALDCANGATFTAAPAIFSLLGAKVSTLACAPDGININAGCGSTHVGLLAQYISAGDFDMGFAFDGDGDRCFAVDENGDVLDGDMIMAVIGKHWASKGKLTKNTIIATVMSNLGFFTDMEKAGLTAEQTQVGDRYVLERMMAGGFCLGGEQSGHIICLDHHTTGDGILTALLLAQIVQETGKTLAQLNTMQKMPQVLKNAKLGNADKEAIQADATIQAEIAALHKKYEGRGRVLIRPSGTEPLIRVMIEGADMAEIAADAARMAQMMEDYSG
ncbi:MAG: phosphoglucosamine mutase [Clostridiales bacterium]|jgi:phosphoglucosamine mutase|nr:phosphoglucosamine mutase [Clostridiales bacterium]